jgi:hypothetical protein
MKVLLSLGFSVHPADPCVYFRLPTSTEPFLAVAVWVDDIFALVANDDQWHSLLTGLRTVFALTDKGDVKMFLGMEILQSEDRATITLSQRISIDNLLSRSRDNMKSQHPAATPCVAGFVFTKGDSPKVPQPRPSRMPEFRGLIALANYISVWTRPDITYVVNKLCKYMANPGDRHLDVFERLLRYLASTRDVGLVYTADALLAPLMAYSDSSHMDCIDTGRSTLAYLFFFFGRVVSWYSKLHTFVTTCSNHSEYAAMFQAAKEAQYLSNWLAPLLPLLGITAAPIPIFNDNDGASALAVDPVGRFKNKHVRMEHHYTQELVAAKIIVPVRVDTSKNKSDLLTKALGPTVFPPMAATLVGLISPPAPAPARVFMFKVVGESCGNASCHFCKPPVPARVSMRECYYGVLTVRESEPSPSRECNECVVGDFAGCGVPIWNMYRVPDGVLGFETPHVGTISGFTADINAIIVDYLGRFCTSTFGVYASPYPPVPPPARPSAPPPARVLMIRISDESRDPRLMRRVTSIAVQTDLQPEVSHTAVQTDLLPEVAHAAVQCDVSSFDGFDGRVRCELGDQSSGLSVRTLGAVLSYSDRVCSVARVLEYQRQLLLDAARAMHDHLDLIRSIDEPLRTAPVLPVVSNTEVKDSVSSGSDDSEGLSAAGEQVEYFQNWATPAAPAVHSIPPSVRACTYCRKGGHQAPQCRRRINDQSYMQVKPPPKRGRRGR